ncbi:MAG: hypothetical protein JXB07_22240 [Anaerolineae bacterium]|nr:hypothetical protein [Anaerolineae bacterium]
MEGDKHALSFASWWPTIRWPAKFMLWLLLPILPLIVGLAWGIYFDDATYAALRCARHLATGRELAYSLVPESPIFRAPLYVLALSLSAAMGIPVPQAALILSMLGWSLATVAIYTLGRTVHRPVAAVVSAILVAVSPLIVMTAGTEIPWAVAWVSICVVTLIRKQWKLQAGTLILLLLTQFDMTMLALALLLLAFQWIYRRRFPLWLFLLLVLAMVGWGVMVFQQLVAPFSLSHLTQWAGDIERIVSESEFYWLFLPFIVLGLLGMAPKARWMGVLWVAVLILRGSEAAGTMLGVLALFLAGCGIDWFIEWVRAQNRFRLDRLTLTVGLTFVVWLPLGVAQLSSLLADYSHRPVARVELEQQAGTWLYTNSEPTETVFGSERIGYLADRPTLPWNGERSDQAELARLLQTLNRNPPAYCVSFKSIGWDLLTRTDWFQEYYAPLQTFKAPHDATSPFVIWGYNASRFEMGEYQPLDMRLPDGVTLVGYRYWPDRVQPGDAIYVSLYLQAMDPVIDTFHTVVRVTSPWDGERWVQQDTIAPPISSLVDWWQRGQPIAQRFVLTMPADIPVGAHQLEMRVAAPQLKEFLPIYQGGNTSPIEQVVLGYVVVPWQGEMGSARPVGANLGDQITLLSFSAPDTVSPGDEFDVTLYWQAQRSPDEDYIVFVHLLDADGQLVAGHDGPPMDGRYATTAWIPAEIVPDIHHLTLEPQIPAGTYRLQVGMYRWPSLEHLVIVEGSGVEVSDRVIALHSIQVR